MPSPFGKDVLAGWPGVLTPVSFVDPGPKLSSTTQQVLRNVGLPKYFCFSNDFELNFSIGTTSATHIENQWLENVENEALPTSLRPYWTIGSMLGSGVGHWVCIESNTGRIVTVDWENDVVVSPLSKSSLTMLRCMLAMLNWSKKCGDIRDDCEELKRQIRLIEPENRWWIYLTEHYLQDNKHAKVGIAKFKHKRAMRTGKVTKKVNRKGRSRA